jgi:hypothetical protein
MRLFCRLGFHWYERYLYPMLTHPVTGRPWIGEYGEGIGVSVECRWCGKEKEVKK